MEPGELLFGSATDPGHVCDVLSSGYRVRTDAPTSARWICLDTADWRLHKAGMTLRDARRGRSGTLILSDGAPRPLTAPSPSLRWPRKIDALPPSPVRDSVAPAIGVRALLPLVEIDVRTLTVRLVDDEGKTRVRVQIDQQRLNGAQHLPLPLRVRVMPLRGYEGDGRRCRSLLTTSIGRLDDGRDAAAAAFSAAGFTPGQCAPELHLDPDAPAIDSLTTVLRRWIDIVDTVRPGVLADIDSEYLHELRTATRAARSLVRLGDALIPQERALRLIEDLTWLGRLTAPLRNLDVYLLELAGNGRVDTAGLTGLEPVRRLLESRRRRTLTVLRTELTSAHAKSVTEALRASVSDITAAAVSTPTTRDAAADLAQTAYQRIIKAARSVTVETDPDHLHRLRRRCKQMRYLLDSFSSVYAPQPHREVLTGLKALQDTLGDIQDVDVQRGHTIELAAALIRRGAAPETLLAVGAFHDRNVQRTSAARRLLDRRLARICNGKMRAQVFALRATPA